MKIFHASSAPAGPAGPADPVHFTGAASMAHIHGLAERPLVNMYRVTFEPSARTAWHTHSGVQLLLVIDGRCRVQKAGEPAHDVSAGGAVRIEPGERHWHGATPGGPMTHLALNIDATTEWFEKVSDAEYTGSAAARK